MKKILVCLLAMILLCASACEQDVRWTDQDLARANSVQIVCYGTEGEQTIFSTHEKEVIQNISNTFSLLDLEKVRTAETLQLSYCVYFMNDAWDEIDRIYILSDNRTVQNSRGKMFRMTDEMDLERHIRQELLPKMEFLQLVLPDED